MRIDINDRYRIQSDNVQIMVIKKAKVSKEGSKNIGEETTRIIGYYHTVQQAFKSLVDQEILDSKATSLKELAEEVRAFKSEIMQHFAFLEEMRTYGK